MAYPAGWDKEAGARQIGPNTCMEVTNHGDGVAVISVVGKLFSEYVEGFAHLSATPTEKLKVGREEDKNGSNTPVVWEEKEEKPFWP